MGTDLTAADAAWLSRRYDAGIIQARFVLFAAGIVDKHPEMATCSFIRNTPGGPSHWTSGRSTKWQPVEPKFVVGVSYDHFMGGRFRHGTSILRWRLDKKPEPCTMDQLEQKSISPFVLLAE